MIVQWHTAMRPRVSTCNNEDVLWYCEIAIKRFLLLSFVILCLAMKTYFVQLLRRMMNWGLLHYIALTEREIGYTPSAVEIRVRHCRLVTKTGLYVIIRKLLGSIFNTLPVLTRWWDIQTCLHGTFLPQGCPHRVWCTLVRRVDRLYFDAEKK
jgi:hypothetical protein